MISRPIVKKIRWRSSVALPRAPQLRFAAICSAADAICPVSFMSASPNRFPVGGAWKTVAYVSGPRPAYNRLFSRGSHNGQLATGFLDGLDGRLGGAGHVQRDLRLDLALGQNADTVQLAAHEARCDQRVLG